MGPCASRTRSLSSPARCSPAAQRSPPAASWPRRASTSTTAARRATASRRPSSPTSRSARALSPKGAATLVLRPVFSLPASVRVDHTLLLQPTRARRAASPEGIFSLSLPPPLRAACRYDQTSLGFLLATQYGGHLNLSAWEQGVVTAIFFFGGVIGAYLRRARALSRFASPAHFKRGCTRTRQNCKPWMSARDVSLSAHMNEWMGRKAPLLIAAVVATIGGCLGTTTTWFPWLLFVRTVYGAARFEALHLRDPAGLAPPADPASARPSCGASGRGRRTHGAAPFRHRGGNGDEPGIAGYLSSGARAPEPAHEAICRANAPARWAPDASLDAAAHPPAPPTGNHPEEGARVGRRDDGGDVRPRRRLRLLRAAGAAGAAPLILFTYVSSQGGDHAPQRAFLTYFCNPSSSPQRHRLGGTAPSGSGTAGGCWWASRRSRAS